MVCELSRKTAHSVRDVLSLTRDAVVIERQEVFVTWPLVATRTKIDDPWITEPFKNYLYNRDSVFGDVSPLLFISEVGSPKRSDNINKSLRVICNKEGIAPVINHANIRWSLLFELIIEDKAPFSFIKKLFPIFGRPIDAMLGMPKDVYELIHEHYQISNNW